MISVVIPVANGDESYKSLLPQLEDAEWDIVLSFTDSGFNAQVERELKANFPWVRSTSGPRGRAQQMNHGWQVSKGDFVWFLHSDSQLDTQCLRELEFASQKKEPALFYFDLKFAETKLRKMKVNEWGVRFRSHFLHMPFGDQGFALSSQLFKELGGFDETCTYGEDHLLVWRCHQEGIPVRCLRAALGTSARKYESQGWLSTTSRHFIATWQQAIPQISILMRQRWKKVL